MDAVSHALVGMAVAGLSGHQPGLFDPVYVAAVLGSQAPDFDIITYLRGSMSYLKHHRAFSHSVLGVFIWSSLITLGICLFIPSTALFSIFAWAFAGGLTHILIDYLNTHGAALWWPFDKSRKSCHLLNVFDPLLFSILLGLYGFKLPMRLISIFSLSIIVIYIGLRFILRKQAADQLKKYFSNRQINRISVMPCLKRVMYWDFVIESNESYSIGQIGVLDPSIKAKADFTKNTPSAVASEAQKTPLGEFFSSFTPFMYFEECQNSSLITVHMYDLRYYWNKHFLHSATFIFEDNVPSKSYIHTLGKTIKIPC